MSITPDQFRRLSATYHNSTAELHRMLEILDQHFDNCRLSDHPENLTGAQIAEFSAAMLRMRSAWIQIRSIIEESGRNTAMIAKYWADEQCVLASADEWQILQAAADRNSHQLMLDRMLGDSDALPPVRRHEPQQTETRRKVDVWACLFFLSLGVIVGALVLR